MPPIGSESTHALGSTTARKEDAAIWTSAAWIPVVVATAALITHSGDPPYWPGLTIGRIVAPVVPIPNNKTVLTDQEQLRFGQPDQNRHADDIKTDAKIIEASREAIRRSLKLLKDIDGDRK